MLIDSEINRFMCRSHSGTEMPHCISLHTLFVTNKPFESLNLSLVESVSQKLELLLTGRN